MTIGRTLDSDPIEEARRQWVAHGWASAADGMAAVTSIVRAQQIVLQRIDTVLRPLDLTFARYEILTLLSFTKHGSLPMTRMGALLQVHPTSVTTNDVVPRLLRRHLPGARFEDSAIELAVTATNLSRGEKHVFREGSLEQAVLASTAIPGVFEPVSIGGELFVDGCVTASVDLATAAEMGATEILAIDLTPAPTPARPKTAAGVLKQSFSILTSATTRAAESCLSRQMPVRVIRPDLSHNSPWRLDDSAGSIARNLRLAADGLQGVFDSEGHIAPDGTCWAMPHAVSSKPEAVSPARFFGASRKAG